MPRVTLKSSTIFISIGNRTEVYRSVADVPPRLRKRLEQSTNGMNSATILIADRRGREEIMRAIRAGSSNLKTRLTASLRDEPPAPAEPKHPIGALTHYWAEMLIPCAAGFLTWFLFSLR